jgi:hypothetical protein
MSYCDPTHWRRRAEEMRVLAEQMSGSVSKHMMHRIAKDYERLALTAEQRTKRSAGNTAVVPAEVRQFGHRKGHLASPPARIPDLEVPRFLKRGPATAEEVGHP